MRTEGKSAAPSAAATTSAPSSGTGVRTASRRSATSNLTPADAIWDRLVHNAHTIRATEGRMEDDMLHYAQVNIPVDVTLVVRQSCADVFNEMEVDVIFKAPDGEEWRVPAFWAGDNLFRARFAAPRPGRYTYRAVWESLAETGLADAVGEIEVAPYQGAHTLYRRGRLLVAGTRRTLQHTDGTPFFWMGDTWWMGLTTRLDWPHGMQLLTADRVAKGFTLIQIVVGPLPDFDARDASWHRQQANEAGWPWEKDWARINPGYYDLADLKIHHLVDSGLVPCIVGMWGFYLPFMGVQRAKQHWRNLVARYAAYPVVWCIAGEVTMPTYSSFGDPARGESARKLQREGWTEVARYVRETDPFHNPLTAHPSYPDSREMLLDESLLDIDMLQTGHDGYRALRPTVETVNACIAKQPRMPVVNSEVCYEGIMGASQQEIQRFVFWTSITSGSAGHTYGAQGIWAMSSRDDPFNGSTASWGDGFWQDVMHYPGSAQVALGRKLLERYPWWLFEPRQDPLLPDGRLSAFATGIPGAIAVYYLPMNCLSPELLGMNPAWGGPEAVTVEAGTSYAAYFLNPRTGAQVDVGSVQDASGKWAIPRKPTMEDWLLVLEGTAALAKLRSSTG